jgi:plasmid stabilization system protein ParE
MPEHLLRPRIKPAASMPLLSQGLLLTHREYLVFYRERSGVIEIVCVIHGRRNIPDILDDL